MIIINNDNYHLRLLSHEYSLYKILLDTLYKTLLSNRDALSSKSPGAVPKGYENKWTKSLTGIGKKEFSKTFVSDWTDLIAFPEARTRKKLRVYESLNSAALTESRYQSEIFIHEPRKFLGQTFQFSSRDTSRWSLTRDLSGIARNPSNDASCRASVIEGDNGVTRVPCSAKKLASYEEAFTNSRGGADSPNVVRVHAILRPRKNQGTRVSSSPRREASGGLGQRSTSCFSVKCHFLVDLLENFYKELQGWTCK